MRVLMLLGKSTGGIGTHVADLAVAVEGGEDEVLVVTDRLTAERFPFPRVRTWWPRARHPLASASGLLRLRRAVASVDVLHAHGHQAGLLAVLLARTVRRPPPVVVSLHNAVLHAAGPRGPLLAVAQRLVATSAALVTGASSDLVDEARRLGARRAELAPVPSPRVPGLRAEPVLDEPDRAASANRLLDRAGISPEGPLVVTVSRIAPQKDLTTLLAAAGMIRLPLTWCVVGDGDPELARDLGAQIERGGLPVHLIGAVPDPAPWLRAASVFVLTSTWEARALVVQEALAAGTPVVCTATGGLVDLATGAGRLVPVGDAVALAAAVEELLRDPAARRALQIAGRERAGTWEDGPATARRWRGWYEALLR